MQLYKRIWIGFLVIFTVSGIQLSLAATEPMADLFQMSEVVVTGTKTERRLKDTPVITEVITRSEIEATGAENIGEVLEHRVGIVVDRDAHGDGVQLQGLDSDYILILLDGEPQVGRIAGKLDLARIAVENVDPD